MQVVGCSTKPVSRNRSALLLTRHNVIFSFFANKLFEAYFNGYGTWAQIFGPSMCMLYQRIPKLVGFMKYSNLIWSCMLWYGHEVMRLVNMKSAWKTFLDLMTDILQLQQKLYLPSLVLVIGKKWF